ncbi:putative protein N(5)-glutamine methyltransferase [Yinghuangia soli]|uniref:peptide chain release factor N(5)-glutamine methyltransferase n=1 Tax=Yinghuangia soli TaxID=2908204 RepID=A0AA41Q192_9ACTN|nr:putative protein N(5)-glutamine methyltransferase [Yinghuangia soli]MCF2529451.1 putative protein N(5)-glutamine methyltransferase [Yinghuangia soli]
MSLPIVSDDVFAEVVSALRTAGCVFAEDEAALLLAAAPDSLSLVGMVERRCSGLPLEHVLGWAEFCGLRLAVAPGVFVPRRRTEFLVHEAVALVHGSAAPGPTVVVDLCCGSGAVGAVLGSMLSDVELHAADIDPDAVRCAAGNLAPVGGTVHRGDLYAALPRHLLGRVDVLVANAPYVPTEEIGLLPSEARDHEPLVALDGGRDGLAIHRRVAEQAPAWLAPGGRLLVETSEHQAPGTAEAFGRSGLCVEIAVCAELYATVVVGTMPA